MLATSESKRIQMYPMSAILLNKSSCRGYPVLSPNTIDKVLLTLCRPLWSKLWQREKPGKWHHMHTWTSFPRPPSFPDHPHSQTILIPRPPSFPTILIPRLFPFPDHPHSKPSSFPDHPHSSFAMLLSGGQSKTHKHINWWQLAHSSAAGSKLRMVWLFV